jgi:hypothetical protein
MSTTSGVEHVLAVSGGFLPPFDEGIREAAGGEVLGVEFPGNVLRHDAVGIAEARGVVPGLLAVGSVAKLVGASQVVGEILSGLRQVVIGVQFAASLLSAKLVRQGDYQLFDPVQFGSVFLPSFPHERSLRLRTILLRFLCYDGPWKENESDDQAGLQCCW